MQNSAVHLGDATAAEKEADQIAALLAGSLAGSAPPPLPEDTSSDALARLLHRPPPRGRIFPTAAPDPALGSGLALPASLRQRLESALAIDISAVRVHTDATAARLTARQRARAFAYGSHIVFSRDAYAPDQIHGLTLLAHELVHVVQQGAPAHDAWSSGALSHHARPRGPPASGLASMLVRCRFTSPRRQCQPDPAPDIGEDELQNQPFDYGQALPKNATWWKKLRLDSVEPLGSIKPEALPNAYANQTYQLQTFANRSGVAKKVFGTEMTEDGVFGPRTFLLLRAMAAESAANPKFRAAVDTANMSVLLGPIQRANPAAVREVTLLALTETAKPKFTVTWHPSVLSAQLWNFWENDYAFGPEMRANVDGLLFGGKPPDTLEDADRYEILRDLFFDEELKTVASLFEVEREFFYYTDLEKLASLEPKPAGTDWRAFFATADSELFDNLLFTLDLEVPEQAEAERLTRALHATGNGKPDKGVAKLVAFGLVAFFPKRTKEQIETAVREYFYEKQLTAKAEEQAAAEWLQSFSADVEKRLGGQPDVADYDTLLELLAGPGGAPVRDPGKINLLVDRAETSLGLVLKLGAEAAPSFLPWPTIRAMRERAVLNAKQPFEFGFFKPPSDSPLNVIKIGFTAREGKSDKYAGATELAFNTSELTKDSTTGEGEGNAWNDWRYFKAERVENLEPVIVRLGDLDPQTTFWVKRWRDVNDTNKWVVKDLWLLGGSLPDLSKQLWEKVSQENIIGFIDAALSILAAASLVAGPLAALEGAGAAAVAGTATTTIVVNVTRSLLTRSFWFVVTEFLAQKFLELDHRIQTETGTYTDSDRQLWKYFKIGLLVLGGTALLKQAWRGLRAGSSAALATKLAEIEVEMAKAEVKTGAQAVTAAGRGLVQAETKIAQRSDELVAAAPKASGGKVELPASTKWWGGAGQKILAYGPRMADRLSAIVEDAQTKDPLVTVAGKPIKDFTAALRGRASKLNAASSGTTQAELAAIDSQVQLLEQSLKSGLMKADSQQAAFALRQILTRLEAVAGQKGLQSVPDIISESILTTLFGKMSKPTKAEMDKYLDEAWTLLHGKNKPAIAADTAVLHKKAQSQETNGAFLAWAQQFGTILLDEEARSAGAIANTVYHEAMHARIRELFPFMSEKIAGSHKRTFLRHFDEVAAYAFGGYGQLTKGKTLADRVAGTLEILLSPWNAYGSANTFREMIPGFIRDAVGFTILLYLAYKKLESLPPPPGAKPASPSGSVQPKLVVDRPGDRYEQEAERAARSAGPGPRLSAWHPTRRGTDEPHFARHLENKRTSGQRLPPATRQSFEARFATDFSDVRVHADPTAHRLNRQLEAHAFTSGRDIYFSSGRYQPGTASGHRLLAHELAHVVQQAGGSATKNFGHVAPAPARAPSSQPVPVQRQPAPPGEIEMEPVYASLADNSKRQDATYARTLARRDATRLRQSEKLSATDRAEINAKLTFFEGRAKAAYAREVKPALIEVTREVIEMPAESVWTNRPGDVLEAIVHIMAGNQVAGDYGPQGENLMHPQYYIEVKKNITDQAYLALLWEWFHLTNGTVTDRHGLQTISKGAMARERIPRAAAETERLIAQVDKKASARWIGRYREKVKEFTARATREEVGDMIEAGEKREREAKPELGQASDDAQAKAAGTQAAATLLKITAQFRRAFAAQTADRVLARNQAQWDKFMRHYLRRTFEGNLSAEGPPQALRDLPTQAGLADFLTWTKGGLDAANAILTLADPVARKKLFAARSNYFGTAAQGAQILQLLVQFISGGVALAGAGAYTIAKVTGNADLAARALNVSGRVFGHISGALYAIGTIHGIAVLLDPDATTEEKAAATVEVASGALGLATFASRYTSRLAFFGRWGGPIGISLNLNFWQFSKLAELRGRAAVGLTRLDWASCHQATRTTAERAQEWMRKLAVINALIAGETDAGRLAELHASAKIHREELIDRQIRPYLQDRFGSNDPDDCGPALKARLDPLRLTFQGPLDSDEAALNAAAAFLGLSYTALQEWDQLVASSIK